MYKVLSTKDYLLLGYVYSWGTVVQKDVCFLKLLGIVSRGKGQSLSLQFQEIGALLVSAIPTS